MVVKDVHFLTLHEPYRSTEHPVPINATIVRASALPHPDVPQPDGGLVYRLPTEFPDRERVVEAVRWLGRARPPEVARAVTRSGAVVRQTAAPLPDAA